MKTFSPSEAAFEGFRLIKARPASVFVWGLVYVLVFALFAAVVWILLGPQLQQALIAGVKNMNHSGTNTRFNISTGPISILIDCAIFRALLRPSQRSFASLRISGDELRVFAVSIGLVIIFILAIVVVLIVAAIPLVIIFKSGFAGSKVVTILSGVLLGIVAVCLLFCASVRLCLASVITFSERRIALLDSWRLTKGNFWNLVGTALLSWLLCALVMFGIVIATAVVCLVVLAPVLGNLTSPSPDYARAMPFMLGAGAVGVVALIFLTSLQRVIMAAPLVYVYRALTGSDAFADEPVEPPSLSGALVL